MISARKLNHEILESRCLAAGIHDSVELWWKINLLRTLSVDGMSRIALTNSSITRQALSPLAWNLDLYDAAQEHASEMSQHNYFSHQSAIDGRWPNKMVRDQGYPLPQSLPADRNDVETIVGGSRFANVDEVLLEIVNNSIARKQMFPTDGNATLATEMGIGNASNLETTFDHFWVMQVAGRHQGERFLTGVVYADNNGNKNFDSGEGLSGIRVSSGELSTMTDASGVYSLAVAGGRHNLRFQDSEQQTLQEVMVSVSDRSVAIDLRTNDSKAEINFRQRSWWTNANNHVDVNRDRFVTPIDALVVINHLNRTGPQSFGAATMNQAFAANAVDTNGDTNLTATDALVVINYLNRG
jgi:hypothetical protein